MMTSDSKRENDPDSTSVDETLARERNMFRTLIDNLPDYIYAKDAQSRFTLNNLAHLQELGAKSSQDAAGKTDYDFFPKNLADQYFADEQEVIRSGKPLVDREESAVNMQGKKQWILTTKVPLRDDSGTVVGIVGMSRDITPLKEAEMALERQVQMQSLVANISSRFIDVPLSEIDGVIHDSLGAIGEYAGVDRSYVLLFHKNGTLVDEKYEWCAPGVACQIQHRQGIEVEKEFPWFTDQVSKLGVFSVSSVAELPAEAEREKVLFQDQGVQSILVVPMSSEGALIGYLGFDMVGSTREWNDKVKEVLESTGRILVHTLSRKMHMEALDYERSFMDALMGNLPDAVYFKDLESRFLRISEALVAKHELKSSAEAEGKSDFDFFTEEHARKAYEDEQEIIRTGKLLVAVIEKETWPDRSPTWVSTTKMPFRNSQGKTIGTFGISRDVTEQKHMEEALAEHAALLEKVNAELEVRNQELDEFSYVASHDLQEPLRKLTAFSDILREDLQQGNEQEVEHDIEVLSSAAQRMQTLVQALLALSRSGRQSMTIETLALDQVIDLALDALELRIEEEQAQIKRVPMPQLDGDKTLLTQLFQNLIGNALKFHGDAPPRIDLSAEKRADGSWLFGVRDNGIGLKQEYAEQIFSAFKRLHRRTAYEGTGIGLAICRKIVERHGGQIWVESEPGQGAHFQFTLSASPEEHGTSG